MVVLLVATLEVVRLRGVQQSAGRTLGAFLDESGAGVGIASVIPDSPAEVGGLLAGDLLVRVDDRPIADRSAYDAAASNFSRGRSVPFEIRREGRTLHLEIAPGVDPTWWPHLLSAFAALVCLALGLIALLQRSDLRARLVAAFSFLLAIELALPLGLIGDPRIETLGMSLFLLATGVQMAVELHLAALTPERPSWVERHAWVVPTFYAIGLGGGALAWATFHIERRDGSVPWPWSHEQSLALIDSVILPLWALGVVVLLALPTVRHSTARGRQQAGLVLLGVLPWALYIGFTTWAPALGWTVPLWLNDVLPLLILGFPLAIFVAIYRYDLFDLQLVVRRGFVYGILTAVLVALFFAAVGGLGSLYTNLTNGDRSSLWVIGAAMFIVGLAFDSLRRGIQHTLDRLLFPEHQALRLRLVALTSDLPSRGTVAGMGRHLVERLADAFSVRSVELLLADPKGGLFFSVASSHDGNNRPSLSFLVPPDDPAILRLRQADSPLAPELVLRDDSMLSHRLASLDAALLVPLPREGQLVGVLVLGHRDGGRRFGREEQDLLNLLGHHAAVVFENIRLFESATYEGLTGLLRREAILDLLDREIERARRYDRPLVVGMADLDYFKQVNDTYGHLGGDAVLKRVADELSDGLRTTDAIGRYGGEEFLLVLPETELDGGGAVAEKLRRRIESLRLEMDDGGCVEPRISIGLADMRGVGKADARALIEAADRALYHAKEQGRNRVEMAPPADADTAEGRHA
ncbi:MAG: diguanylate cyclase [Acidobacteriota bacterium]